MKKSSALLFIIFLLLQGCGNAKASSNANNNSKSTVSSNTTARQSMPNFTLEGLDGNQYAISQFRGRVLIVDFWATWCGPCKVEIPFLENLYSQYKDKGLTVIGVGLDNPVALQRFSDAMGMNYMVLKGTQAIAQQFQIRAIPTTYILDKKGRIAHKFVGFSPSMKQTFESLVQSLLKE